MKKINLSDLTDLQRTQLEKEVRKHTNEDIYEVIKDHTIIDHGDYIKFKNPDFNGLHFAIEKTAEELDAWKSQAIQQKMKKELSKDDYIEFLEDTVEFLNRRVYSLEKEHLK